MKVRVCYHCGEPYAEDWPPSLCVDGKLHLICGKCNTAAGRVRAKMTALTDMDTVTIKCWYCGTATVCEEWCKGTCLRCGCEYEWSEMYALTKESFDAKFRPIPVTDRLPEPKKNCFAYTHCYGWMLSVYDGEDWYVFGNSGNKFTSQPTHWMELPPKPE